MKTMLSPPPTAAHTPMPGTRRKRVLNIDDPIVGLEPEVERLVFDE